MSTPPAKNAPIPFNRPVLSGDEIRNINEAIDREQLAGDGEFTRRCEHQLREIITADSVLLTHSCTAALEMAALLLELQPGDEVIMPSYTFVSTANAVVLRGATPVFVDIRPDTLNLDETLIGSAITDKTRAIFVVHYAGVVCEMEAILEIARRHQLAVVEDAAQALTSTYASRQAGSFGDLACFSFHETKNIISGEGGCLAINNPALVERAEIIREKGTNRKNFFRGMVDKYTWVDIGSSYIPGELIAAFLCAQLSSINTVQKERLAAWGRYYEALGTIAETHPIKLPMHPDNTAHNAHLFYLLAPEAAQRDALIQAMRERQVGTPFHYVPLHTSPAGLRYCRTSGRLPVTEDLSARLLRLPMYPGVSRDQERIISALQESISHVIAPA